MRTNANGRKYITLEEGRARFDSKTGLYFPYRDQKGYWTIGVGHLIRPNEDFSRGITAERVDQLLETDILKCDLAIDELLDRHGRQLNQNQWNAFASLLLNIGIAWALPEKGSLARAIDKGEYDRVPELFLLYDVSGGVHEPFLAARRRREAKLWSTPVDASLDEVHALVSAAAALRYGALDLLKEEDLSGREWDDEPTPVKA